MLSKNNDRINDEVLNLNEEHILFKFFLHLKTFKVFRYG